jgi:hypothetical protein
VAHSWVQPDLIMKVKDPSSYLCQVRSVGPVFLVLAFWEEAGRRTRASWLHQSFLVVVYHYYVALPSIQKSVVFQSHAHYGWDVLWRVGFLEVLSSISAGLNRCLN